MKKRKTNERGITLISLVITIILLLILATVAISLAVDSDGLFSKAGEAANKWNTSVAQEDAALQNLMTMLDEMDNGKTLGDVYNDDMIGQKLTYEADGQNNWIVFGKDKNGNILITTAEPIADGFELVGSAENWLSYEDDLHTACSVYGGTVQGTTVTSRSITMEDINYVTGFEEPEFTTFSFGTTMNVDEHKINYYYPSEDAADNGYWKLPEEDGEITFECNAYSYASSGYMCFDWTTEDVIINVETTSHINADRAAYVWGENLEYLVATQTFSYGLGYVEPYANFHFCLVRKSRFRFSWGRLYTKWSLYFKFIRRLA